MTARSRHDRHRRLSSAFRPTSQDGPRQPPTGLIWQSSITHNSSRRLIRSQCAAPSTLTTTMAFTLKSAARLPGGHQIPLLGLGVYQNYDAGTSVFQALEAGYRHIDSAQAYRNEEAVGQGVARSKVKREDIFISKEQSTGSYLWGFQRKLMSTPRPLPFLSSHSE